MSFQESMSASLSLIVGRIRLRDQKLSQSGLSGYKYIFLLLVVCKENQAS